jgi:hypothetical protein
LVAVIKVATPEPNLVIISDELRPQILGLEASDLATLDGHSNFLNTALLLPPVKVSAIKLPIHARSKPIKAPIICQKEIMMPPCTDLSDV